MAEGHRERVKRRFLTEDLESFEAHNALEFLLFYGLPRIDTNGIAHRLIDRFGSFSEVLEAPLDELASVEGVGDNAAIFLKLIHSTVKYYEDDVARRSAESFDSKEAIGKFLIEKYAGEENEKVMLLLLDNRGGLIESRVLQEGSVNSANVNVRRVTEIALRGKASSVVIAHNHPRGIAFPSAEDIEVTKSISRALSLVDITLLDHYIVAANSFIRLSDV